MGWPRDTIRAMKTLSLRIVGCAVAVAGSAGVQSQADRQGEWTHYAADAAATHYSPLMQITRENVGELAPAWEWKPGEKALPQFGTRPGAFQNTPLMIDNMLYLSTPYNQVVALDPETGEERWRFDPKTYEDGQPPNGTGYVHRGVAAWRDGGTLRIFLNTRYRLIQLDAKTGQPVKGFGRDGVVDLSEGLVWAINRKHYTNTSPPLVYKDLIILGNGVGDRLTYRNDPPGDVRAFHARTGRLVWTFHTIPQSGEFGNNTWDNDSWRFTGHTNVWAPMSLDDERGLLYLPVSTPSNDWYGGRRPAPTSSASRSSASTPPPACASGTTRSCTTACGTTTCRPRRSWRPSPWTAGASTPRCS